MLIIDLYIRMSVGSKAYMSFACPHVYPVLCFFMVYRHIANQLFADKFGIFLYTITTNHHQTVFSWLHYSLVAFLWLLSKFPQLLRSLIRFEHPYNQSSFSCIYAQNIISCYWYGQIHVDWKYHLIISHNLVPDSKWKRSLFLFGCSCKRFIFHNISHSISLDFRPQAFDQRLINFITNQMSIQW